jgi:MFS transporter, FSR family, fosmidomycin resistance protein
MVRRRGSSVLVALVGAHVTNDFYVTVLPVFLPAVALEFDLDYTELGILSFAFMVLGGLLPAILGNYSDRSGHRRGMLVFGFSVGALGFLAMSAAPSFWFIVAVSSLCGLGGATYHPQASAILVQAFPENRGRMLGIHGWGGSIGHFLAPIVVVYAISAFGWRFAMVTVAVPLLVTALVLRMTLVTTPPNPAASLRGAVGSQLILVAVTFGVLSMVGRGFLTFVVTMLVDEGWTQTSAGTLFTFILIVGVVAQPLGGRIFDRRGGRNVFIGAAIGMVVSVGLFAATTGPVSLFAVAGVAFFMFSLFPVVLALASQLVGQGQTGAATGIVFGVSGLMGAMMQPYVGALAERLGDIRVALAWQLPLAFVGLFLATRIRNPGAKREKAPPRGRGAFSVVPRRRGGAAIRGD